MQILLYSITIVILVLLVVWLTTNNNRHTHAGGIVYRKDNGRTLFLIVSSLTGEHKWVLPKGHIEKGETAEFAAVREVREEAGVSARPIKKAGVIYYTKKGKSCSAVYFIMEFLGVKGQGSENRQVLWLEKDEALKKLGDGKRAGLFKRVSV